MKCAFCNVPIRSDQRYCHGCGLLLPRTEFDEILVGYFKRGYLHKEIIGLLQSQHCIRICLRTLNKRFKCLGLSRKYSYTNENVRNVESTVLSEIQGSSSDMGYRSVWHHLRCNRGVFTSRNFVMCMIKDMDPEGVSRRRRRHRLKR